MSRTTTVLLFACVLLGAVAIAMWRRETPAPLAQPSVVSGRDTHGEQVANLSTKVEELERALAAMKQQQAAQRGNQPSSVNPAAAPASPNEDAEKRPTREQAAEQYKERMATIASSFEREKLDPVWSKQAASQVAAAFETDNVLRAAATNLECREQTCRIQIDDPDRTASARIPSIAGKLGKSLPNIAADRIELGNGRSALVLYITRGRSPS